MMRIVLAAGIIVAAVSFNPHSVRAAEGPWCAFISVGFGSVYEDCRYSSIEECRPNVLSGNRGFCNHNPRWVDGPGTRPRKRQAQRN